MRDLESDFRRSPVSIGSTSPELLAASKRADPAAWERLVAVYSPLVYSWSRHFGLPPEAAKDIVQDVLRAVFTNLERFDTDREDGSFRGWLRTITNNKMIDRLRCESNQTQAIGGSDAQQRLGQIQDVVNFLSGAGQAGSSGLSSRGSEERALHKVIKRVRGDFTDLTWQAFWGMMVDNRSSTELGTELQMSGAAVRLAKARVLRRLREELSQRSN